MSKTDDAIKRRARQIQRSNRAVQEGWKYRHCLIIARREFKIEQEWRENFRRMNYDEEQIRIGIERYRRENRERYEMGRKDPEGTETRSETEQKQRQDKVARDFVGLPDPKNDNPEGVPAGDEGHGKSS